MSTSNRGSKPIWTYAYEILPPQSGGPSRAITKLLDAASAEARRDDRTWEARAVVEHRLTHILVVTDSPEQEREVNRKLEGALTALGATFSLTAPLAVPGQGPLPPPK